MLSPMPAPTALDARYLPLPVSDLVELHTHADKAINEGERDGNMEENEEEEEERQEDDCICGDCLLINVWGGKMPIAPGKTELEDVSEESSPFSPASETTIPESYSATSNQKPSLSSRVAQNIVKPRLSPYPRDAKTVTPANVTTNSDPSFNSVQHTSILDISDGKISLGNSESGTTSFREDSEDDGSWSLGPVRERVEPWKIQYTASTGASTASSSSNTMTAPLAASGVQSTGPSALPLSQSRGLPSALPRFSGSSGSQTNIPNASPLVGVNLSCARSQGPLGVARASERGSLRQTTAIHDVPNESSTNLGFIPLSTSVPMSAAPSSNVSGTDTSPGLSAKEKMRELMRQKREESSFMLKDRKNE